MDVKVVVGCLTLGIAVSVGLVESLDCIACDWSIKNETMDSDCLGAPYKTKSLPCPPSSSGERYMCQIHVEFESKSGVMGLATVNRMCALKHSRCNNACAEDTTDCYSCCSDNDNCNTFPLRTNVVSITSSANMSASNRVQLAIWPVFAAVWSLIYKTCVL